MKTRARGDLLDDAALVRRVSARLGDASTDLKTLQYVSKALRDGVPMLVQEIELLLATFGHIHYAGDPCIDRCAQCGLDIRNEIHTRTPKGISDEAK